MDTDDPSPPSRKERPGEPERARASRPRHFCVPPLSPPKALHFPPPRDPQIPQHLVHQILSPSVPNLSCAAERRSGRPSEIHPALAFLLLLLGALATASASALSGGDHLPFTLLPADPAVGCHGSVAECLASAELGLDGDLHHHVLYGFGYISYAVLCRGSVPCSHRGASYYNCRPGTQANPYHRSCLRITRCRG